jgi:hypothetical protein
VAGNPRVQVVELVEALWRSGAFEERLLAAKLLGAVARQDSVRALEFVNTASEDLSDWAVCDTLGTQGARTIALAQRKTIVAMAGRLTRSRHVWARRLAIVLLLDVAADPMERATVRRILAPLVAPPATAACRLRRASPLRAFACRGRDGRHHELAAPIAMRALRLAVGSVSVGINTEENYAEPSLGAGVKDSALAAG